MKEYLEQQLKKKAHELVMTTFKVVSRIKGHKGPAISLRKVVGKIPAAIFEGQSREYAEDKLKYFFNARNAIFEAKYYTDLLYNDGAISYYSYQKLTSKIELLDKMLVSRIRALDKKKAGDEYKVNVRARYFGNNQ
ncbi:MAG: four helix bundle protein [Patescibacteria group bacterium]|nr:four helix bundle protein [Patescibacteria group bacterium]